MGKRGFFRSKRGVVTKLLTEAMQALAIMLILTGSMSYVGSKLEKVGFAKAFYARDMGLLTTALYSPPGNVFYLYYIDSVEKDNPSKYKFSFEISDNLVKVNASNSSKQNLYWYFSDIYSEPINFQESGILGLLRFEKEGSKIKVGRAVSLNRNMIVCPLVYTKDQAWRQKSFVFDAGHGENASDTGAVNSNDATFSEESLTSFITKSIPQISQQKKVLTREEGGYAALAKREGIVNKADPSAAIISLHIGDVQDKNINYIKAYYNIGADGSTREKSAKLGCSILNAILGYEKLNGRDKINGVAVIPSDSEYIQKIIPSGRTGVLLELGNIQIQKQDNFLADRTSVAEAIYYGIESYYENE